jgi:hypothetical protein
MYVPGAHVLQAVHCAAFVALLKCAPGQLAQLRSAVASWSATTYSPGEQSRLALQWLAFCVLLK